MFRYGDWWWHQGRTEKGRLSVSSFLLMKPFDDILTRRSQRLKFIGGKDDFMYKKLPTNIINLTFRQISEKSSSERIPMTLPPLFRGLIKNKSILGKLIVPINYQENYRESFDKSCLSGDRSGLSEEKIFPTLYRQDNPRKHWEKWIIGKFQEIFWKSSQSRHSLSDEISHR